MLVGPKYKADAAYRGFPGAVLPPREPKARWRRSKTRVRVEHVIARLKDWRVLRFCRVRGLITDVFRQ